MKILYSGFYSTGSTSQMRGKFLQDILKPDHFVIADTDLSFNAVSKISLSFGWHFKIGPLIDKINQQIVEKLGSFNQYDIAWIDKGVFVRPQVLNLIREKTNILIHYTPDPAFLYHSSRFFKRGIHLYDYVVTTKKFEQKNYYTAGAQNVLFATQGYDPILHRPYHAFSEKSGISFIGHHEEYREEIIRRLVENGFVVKLAGQNWEKIVAKLKRFNNLEYLGSGLYGEDYAKLISSSMFSLGFLSKWIPEKHTTRTIEIPACGTALLTESNDEINEIFTKDEVLYYNSISELMEMIQYYTQNLGELQKISFAGYKKVSTSGFDYRNIMLKCLIEMGLVK